MFETVLTTMREAIESNLYLRYDAQSDIYRTEIYTDYRDELDEKTIIKIMESEKPLETFYDLLSECYLEAMFEEQGYIEDQIKEYFCDNDMENVWEENHDSIRDWLMEHVCVDIPYRRYLDQDVQVDIIVDTGDGNYDYTLNCVYPHYNGIFGETIDEKASILWLARQQGYTKRQINKALRHGDYGGSKFLKSMKVEVLNCSTHMNALTFFVNMTLEEAIFLGERLKARKKSDHIVLDKNTCCGLYDCWNGAGSALEITLEKDVVLPVRYISTALPDGGRGCGVGEIYGIDSSFYEPGGLKSYKNIKIAA